MAISSKLVILLVVLYWLGSGGSLAPSSYHALTNFCTDTVILKNEFPLFPYGERQLTRDWLLVHFKLKKDAIMFQSRNLGKGYKDSVFLVSVGSSTALFSTGLTGPHIKKYRYDKYLTPGRADILDARIALGNGVRVGITKYDFFRAISVVNPNLECDQFLIVDEEWQAEHKFFFRADTLYKIKLQFMD